MKILIADESSYQRLQISYSLNKNKEIECFLKSDMNSTLTRLEEGDIDIVIIDAGLGSSQRSNFIKRINEISQKTKVILTIPAQYISKLKEIETTLLTNKISTINKPISSSALLELIKSSYN
jgi:DNA-binding NtrC family response regulator